MQTHPFFYRLINQSFVRYVALYMHNFLAKPLISAYTCYYVCTKPCRQPSHIRRTVVINVLAIAKGIIVDYTKVPYTIVKHIWFVYHSLHGFVYHHLLYMVLYAITRYTWLCIPLYTWYCIVVLGFEYHPSLFIKRFRFHCVCES